MKDMRESELYTVKLLLWFLCSLASCGSFFVSLWIFSMNKGMHPVTPVIWAFVSLLVLSGVPKHK